MSQYSYVRILLLTQLDPRPWASSQVTGVSRSSHAKYSTWDECVQIWQGYCRTGKHQHSLAAQRSRGQKKAGKAAPPGQAIPARHGLPNDYRAFPSTPPPTPSRRTSAKATASDEEIPISVVSTDPSPSTSSTISSTRASTPSTPTQPSTAVFFSFASPQRRGVRVYASP